MEKPYKNTHKRKRKRRRKLAELAKKRILNQQTKPKAGDVTKYFQWYDPKKHRHYNFSAMVRVSSGKQVEQGYLESQLYRMEKFAKEQDLKIIDNKLIFIVKSAFWSGSQKELARIDSETDPLFSFDPKRPYYKPHYLQLEISKIIMNPYKPNAAFLFESVDRAIRSDDFSLKNKDAPLTEEELEAFAEVVNPFPVITICPPEATYNDIERYRKIYGAGFIPPKPKVDRKKRYHKYHDKVIGLHFVEGLSYQKVFEELKQKVPKSSIIPWCQQYEKEQ